MLLRRRKGMINVVNRMKEMYGILKAMQNDGCTRVGLLEEP